MRNTHDAVGKAVPDGGLDDGKVVLCICFGRLIAEDLRHSEGQIFEIRLFEGRLDDGGRLDCVGMDKELVEEG